MTAPFTPDSAFAATETPRDPSSSISITALARFEFEAGKSNDGTKILMIEWEDDDLSRSSSSSSTAPGSSSSSWHVAWEGKKAVLPADEQTSESTRRFYFLLPPNVTIPPVVTLSYEPSKTSTDATAAEGRTDGKKPESLQLNPLPAIFPPELGATGRSAGKKGVLHTVWAKKRLQVLDKEIREECLNNAEGIALHMALQEKDWIETHFGVGSKADIPDHNGNSNGNGTHYPMGPTTPVSPTGGGKLGEKLKGLKLQTSEQGLSPKAEGELSIFYYKSVCISFTDIITAPSNAARHLLSPQSPDVAISSFKSFNSIPNPNPAPKAVAHYPPESIQVQQHVNDGSSGFASMGSIAGPSSNSDSGEELFAKALSPRSPDLPRSPFSFAPESLRM